MQKIIFDVGACEGYSFNMLHGDPNISIYAFEADPKFYPYLEGHKKGNPNYHPFNMAVTDFDGIASFNICPDSGCSSLLNFAPNVEETWKVRDPIWDGQKVPGTDSLRYFKHTSSIDVKTTRLDTIIKQYNITHIDILHIDTQGNDLKVLESLGTYIDIVKSGEIEVPSSPSVALYDKQCTKENCLEFLKKHGFEVIGIKSNDPFNFEENIQFKRKQND